MWMLNILVATAALSGGGTYGMEVSPFPGLASGLMNSTEGNLNEYLDMILEETKSRFDSLHIDPLSLPDLYQTFSKSIWFVTLWGGFRTTQGMMTGMKSIHRAGDVTLRTSDDGNTITVDGSLAVSNIHVSAQSMAWFSFLKVYPHLSATASYMRASMEMQIPNDGEDLQPKATRFDIEDIHNLHMSVSNLGPLNWIANSVIKSNTEKIKTAIRTHLPTLALNAINEQIVNLVAAAS